jgi:hypothetical protein
MSAEVTGSNEEPRLRALELDVEADIELSVAGEESYTSPADWSSDPGELEYEAVELRSLRGAIEALADDQGRDGESPVSSG